MIAAVTSNAPSAIMDCQDRPGNDNGEIVMQDFSGAHNPRD